MIVSGINNDEAKTIATVADNSNYYPGTINYLQRFPFYNTNDYIDLEYPYSSKLQVKSPKNVDVSIIVIGSA